MKVPSREDLAQSGSLEELYGKLNLVGIGPGWQQADAVAVAGAAEEFRAGALEIRAGARRARRRRPPDQHRARRAAQSHPRQSGRGQRPTAPCAPWSPPIR